MPRLARLLDVRQFMLRDLLCRTLRQDGPHQEGPKGASQVLEQTR